MALTGTLTLSNNATVALSNDNVTLGTTSIKSQCVPNSQFGIGGACANQLEIGLLITNNNLTNAKLTLFDDETQLGLFYVDNSTVKRTKNGISFTAFDGMIKFDDIQITTLTSGTAYSIISNLCSQAGITLATTQAVINAMPNGTKTLVFNAVENVTYNARDVLSYVVSVLGGFARINTIGNLEIVQFTTTSSFTLNADNCVSRTISDTSISVTGISYNDVSVGSTGYVLDMTNNPFVTSSNATLLLTNIYNKVKLLTFYDAQVTWFGSLSVKAGDCVTYEQGDISRKIIVMSNTWKYRRNGRIYSYADIDQQNYSAVGKLSTTMIKVSESLTSTTARIGTIEADYVTATYVSANYADINLANIANGSIKNAMIDTGAVGTAQIADGSITDAKIVGLTATKILAGTLDAGIVNVINLNCANLTVGTINGQQIADNAVTYGKIADTAVKSITDTIDIGGTNLLLDSGVEISNNIYLVRTYTPSTPLVAGETYTMSICVTPASGVYFLMPTVSNGYRNLGNIYVSGTTKQIVTATFIVKYYAGRTPDDNIEFANISLYRFPNDGTVTGNTTIHWIKVEKGNKATDYSPAPEDITVENVYTPGTKTIAGAKITPLTLTENLIATGAITTDKIVANAVTAAKIATKTITANEIATQTITANELNVANLSAISANLGTVTAGVIQSANYVSGSAGMKLTLSTGVWDSAYFKLSANGTLTATAGTIGGFAITSNLLYAQTTAGYTTLKTGGDVAIACGSPSYSNTTDAAMQIYHNGTIRVGYTTSNQIRLNAGNIDFWYNDVKTGRLGQPYGTDPGFEDCNLLITNGDLKLIAAAKYLYGAEKRLIGVTSANNIAISADTNVGDTNIYSGDGYVTNLFAGATKVAYIYTGGVYLPNAKYLIGVTTTGTTSNLIGCTSANNVAVNSDNVGTTNLYGTAINLMPNGTKVASFDTTGLSFVNGCGVVCNSSIAMRWYSNALYVGIDTQPLKLVGTSITAPTFSGLTTTGLTVNGTATMAGLTVNGGSTAYSLTTSYNINAGANITAGGNITMTANATYLYGKSDSAVSQRIIGVTSSNNIAIGSPGNAGSLNAYVPTNQTINAYINTTRIAYVDSGGIKLTSGKYLYMIDGSDNLLRAVSVYTTNQLGFGSSGITSQLLGTFKGTVSASSDRRAKHNIISLSDKYTAMLDHLDAVSYQYNAPLDGRYNITNCGFIAQDVLSALSEVGLTAQEFGGFVDSDNMYALDYTQFVPILWAIVKKQQEQIKSLLTE